MTKLEMIELLVCMINAGIANSDWRLHESCNDAKCVVDMANAMLEQEDYHGGVVQSKEYDNYEGDGI